MTQTNKILVGAVVVAGLLAVYIFVDRKSSNNMDTNTPLNQDTATSTNPIISGGNGYTIEQIPIDSGTSSVPKPIPHLGRQPVLYSGAVVTAEALEVAKEKIRVLQTNLIDNPANLPAWIDLGMYQKMAGDYEGARISWVYATKLSPTSYVAFGNLGHLYAYFIKDNGQAEVYYKEALRVGPTQIYLYVQIAEVYRDVFKDKEKALDIVNQGLTKVPNDSLLLQLKASLQ